MNLRPLHDWVVISRSEPTENQFWLPDEPHNRGYVIAIGPGVREVEVGDTVQFNPYAGLNVTTDGHTWLFLHEAEISFVEYS